MVFGLLVFGALALCFIVGWFMPPTYRGLTYQDPYIFNLNNVSHKLDTHMNNIQTGLYDRLSNREPSNFTNDITGTAGIIADVKQTEKADKI